MQIQKPPHISVIITDANLRTRVGCALSTVCGPDNVLTHESVDEFTRHAAKHKNVRVDAVVIATTNAPDALDQHINTVRNHVPDVPVIVAHDPEQAVALQDVDCVIVTMGSKFPQRIIAQLSGASRA